MVERRTPEPEVGVRSSLRSPCCILEQDTFTFQKSTAVDEGNTYDFNGKVFYVN